MVDEGEAQAFGVEAADGVIIDLQQAPRLDYASRPRICNHHAGGLSHFGSRFGLLRIRNFGILGVPPPSFRAVSGAEVLPGSTKSEAQGRRGSFEACWNRAVLGGP